MDILTMYPPPNGHPAYHDCRAYLKHLTEKPLSGSYSMKSALKVSEDVQVACECGYTRDLHDHLVACVSAIVKKAAEAFLCKRSQTDPPSVLFAESVNFWAVVKATVSELEGGFYYLNRILAPREGLRNIQQIVARQCVEIQREKLDTVKDGVEGFLEQVQKIRQGAQVGVTEVKLYAELAAAWGFMDSLLIPSYREALAAYVAQVIPQYTVFSAYLNFATSLQQEEEKRARTFFGEQEAAHVRETMVQLLFRDGACDLMRQCHAMKGLVEGDEDRAPMKDILGRLCSRQVQQSDKVCSLFETYFQEASKAVMSKNLTDGLRALAKLRLRAISCVEEVFPKNITSAGHLIIRKSVEDALKTHVDAAAIALAELLHQIASNAYTDPTAMRESGEIVTLTTFLSSSRPDFEATLQILSAVRMMAHIDDDQRAGVESTLAAQCHGSGSPGLAYHLVHMSGDCAASIAMQRALREKALPHIEARLAVLSPMAWPAMNAATPHISYVPRPVESLERTVLEFYNANRGEWYRNAYQGLAHKVDSPSHATYKMTWVYPMSEYVMAFRGREESIRVNHHFAQILLGWFFLDGQGTTAAEIVQVMGEMGEQALESMQAVKLIVPRKEKAADPQGQLGGVQLDIDMSWSAKNYDISKWSTTVKPANVWPYSSVKSAPVENVSERISAHRSVLHALIIRLLKERGPMHIRQITGSIRATLAKYNKVASDAAFKEVIDWCITQQYAKRDSNDTLSFCP